MGIHRAARAESFGVRMVPNRALHGAGWSNSSQNASTAAGNRPTSRRTCGVGGGGQSHKGGDWWRGGLLGIERWGSHFNSTSPPWMLSPKSEQNRWRAIHWGALNPVVVGWHVRT